MAELTLADILADLLGEIITDVRQHVVEEPWFGRAVGDDINRHSSNDRDKSQDISVNIEL